MADIFIGNTKIKKLKKLYKISINLIQEFGFRYFLHVFFEELIKQKTKLFLPDESPKIDFTQFTSNYKKFMEKHKLETSDLELVNKISKLYDKPKISLFLIHRDNVSVMDLENSISSIVNQVYENFDLQVINLSSSNLDSFKHQFSSNKVNFIEGMTFLSLKKLLSYSESEIIGFLDNSVVLQNNLPYYFIEKFYQNPESDVFYFDEDYLDTNGNRINPFFKPDWSPYLFCSMNYLGNFCLFKKSILDKITGYDIDSKNNFLYDILLRCSEISDKFLHISLPLFSVKNTVNPQSLEYEKNCISSHLKRINIIANVEDGYLPQTYRVHYELESEPKVSIIIPTKDKKELLQRCINSIKNNTSYKNLEIIIIDNNSEDLKTIEYLRSLPYQILQYSEPFNFSKMNNLAVTKSSGKYLLFLNDDTAALESNWLTEMISICQQNDIGVVGAKLVHSDDTIQHAGMVFLTTGAGFHPFQRFPQNSSGYYNFINVIREFSAVTGACLLTKRNIFDKVGGFDDDFDLYYGDSDLCLKIRDAGFRIVYTPYAKLLHEGSASIRKHGDAFFTVENHYQFIKKWSFLKNGDPFYSPYLDWNYSIRKNPFET